ncbi:hypothetical protein VTO73DRAFT_2585 [Trametes versicolor]
MTPPGYVNPRADPGWTSVSKPTGGQGAMYTAPDTAAVVAWDNLSSAEGPGYLLRHGPNAAVPDGSHGEGSACGPFAILPQYDYQLYPRAPAPEIELTIPYEFVPLQYALEERGTSLPDIPAFARDAPIGDKLSICLGIKSVHPPRELANGFSSKQHRVRSGNGRGGRPITRASLARLVAVDVQTFMNLYLVTHNGNDIGFHQLYLKEVSLKSKATIQPVMCLHRLGSGQR